MYVFCDTKLYVNINCVSCHCVCAIALCAVFQVQTWLNLVKVCSGASWAGQAMLCTLWAFCLVQWQTYCAAQAIKNNEFQAAAVPLSGSVY